MALLAALSASACTDVDDPQGSPSPTAASPTAVVSVTPGAASSPVYRAKGFDLCRRVSLEPLADLKLTVRRTDPTPPPTGPGAACLFGLRTADGHEATLRVSAVTPASVDEAALVYRTTARVTVMRPEGPVAGVGEEAQAFSRETEPGFRYSEYLIQARTANLVVEVWLAVGGKAFTPKAQLAADVRAVLTATLAQVPPA